MRGGFQLGLGADMHFVAPDAQLSVMEIKWGLIPDMAGIVLLRGLVRDDVAPELIFSGRIFSDQEALGRGLATRVCDEPRGEALAFAKEVSPDAIRHPNGSSPRCRGASARTMTACETDEQVKLIGSPNQVAAVRANSRSARP
jgi:enoyl-CoA hydratase/carnithine racemase